MSIYSPSPSGRGRGEGQTEAGRALAGPTLSYADVKTAIGAALNSRGPFCADVCVRLLRWGDHWSPPRGRPACSPRWTRLQGSLTTTAITDSAGEGLCGPGRLPAERFDMVGARIPTGGAPVSPPLSRTWRFSQLCYVLRCPHGMRLYSDASDAVRLWSSHGHKGLLVNRSRQERMPAKSQDAEERGSNREPDSLRSLDGAGEH
jgi:hypothetical protein